MCPELAMASRSSASALIAGGLTIAVMSCGSRTGLFVPEPDFFSGDATVDGGMVDANDDGPIQCIPGQFTFELALTQLMFVVDRSGSMRFTVDGVEDASRSKWRWTLLQNALRKTITPFDNEIAMGAKFFPEVMTPADLRNAERSCRSETGVGFAPSRGNAKTILDVFDTTEPRGGTPTSEAVRLAAQFLGQRRSVANAIVLATDGAPNCNGDLDTDTCTCTSTSPCTGSVGRFSCLDEVRTVETIRSIADVQKVPVYVIGIGSTESPEFLQVLDDMAVAGGRPRPTTPRHYNAQSENDLTLALTTIRDTVAKCTYLSPSAPNDPNKITVRIDGAVIPRDQTKTNGWDWVDQGFGELAFFGDACTKARGSSGLPATVSGVVSCEE
jgi:hypothetical protein